MTATKIKNGVNTLSPLNKEKERIKKNLEHWKSILAIYDNYKGSSLDKDRKETQELINELEKELEIISRIENILSQHSKQKRYWKLLELYQELLNTRRELEHWENPAADYDWLLESLNSQIKQLEEKLEVNEIELKK